MKACLLVFVALCLIAAPAAVCAEEVESESEVFSYDPADEEISTEYADIEDEDDENELEEDDDDEEDVDEDDAPVLAADRKIRRKEALKFHAQQKRVARLYKNLQARYTALRNEISGRVRKLMWRKLSWLRLLYARKRWFLINRRYRNLIAKFRALPSKQFLVKAWKKYKNSEEYNLHESRRKYRLSAKRANKYLKNLQGWVTAQRDKLRALRRRVRTFLRNNGQAMTEQQREAMRLDMRRNIRAEQKKLGSVLSYWTARIDNDDLPVRPKETAEQVREKKLVASVPKVIPVPKPMVKPLPANRLRSKLVPRANGKGVRVVKTRAGKGEGKWIRALLARAKVPKKAVKKVVKKVVKAKKAKKVIKLIPGEPEDWLAPVRRFRSKSMKKIAAKKARALRKKMANTRQGKHRISVFGEWKQQVKRAFTDAWKK